MIDNLFVGRLLVEVVFIRWETWLCVSQAVLGQPLAGLRWGTRCGNDALRGDCQYNMSPHPVILLLLLLTSSEASPASNQMETNHPSLASPLLESSGQCSAAQQFVDSVKFEQCKTAAWLRLLERPPTYVESLYSKVGGHTMIDFQYTISCREGEV